MSTQRQTRREFVQLTTWAVAGFAGGLRILSPQPVVAA